jgi:hypothetical protein
MKYDGDESGIADMITVYVMIGFIVVIILLNVARHLK